ncbi:MAG: 50S ribosomal protein L18 [archaeon]
MKVNKRRRKERVTDYKSRLNLLKSGLPRVVFRKSNKFIIGQYIKSEKAQDSIIAGATSKDLLDYGWPIELRGSLKSLTASYLTGFLLGRKIIDKEGESRAIFDIGLLRNIAKSRAYAFLKGVIDSGVIINHNEKMFPIEDKIQGNHLKKNIKEIFGKVKEKIEHG